MVPWMADAIVVACDGQNYKVSVALQGGLGCQVLLLPVDVALHGHNDGLRGHWPPLPAVGTHGRVSFTRGDLRNARWEGAHRANLTDSCSHTAADPNLDYTAHFDGGWSWHGGDGTVAEVFADGSSWLLGGSMPVPTRNTLSSGQARQAVPFLAAQRVPNPPAPLPFSFTHSTGVKVSISASGAVVVSGLSGQPVALYGGGCAMVMNGGVVTISGALVATGNVTASGGTGASVDLLGHLHSAGGGVGNSGPPVPGS